jgi:hypothetical protein
MSVVLLSCVLLSCPVSCPGHAMGRNSAKAVLEIETLLVPVYFLKAKQGYTDRKKRKILNR